MKQQTIIIIGATSGIGKTLFEKYAADGNRIGIVGRRTHLLDELRQEHPDMTVTATADKGHGDRYIGSLFRVDEPVPDDSLLLLNWFSMNVIVIILGVNIVAIENKCNSCISSCPICNNMRFFRKSLE